jgi:hypothetical protein
MMPTDLKELLRAFNDHGVKYLVVGGYAFGVYAEPRATKDLDLSSAPTTRMPRRYFGLLPSTAPLSPA